MTKGNIHRLGNVQLCELNPGDLFVFKEKPMTASMGIHSPNLHRTHMFIRNSSVRITFKQVDGYFPINFNEGDAKLVVTEERLRDVEQTGYTWTMVQRVAPL